MYMQIYNNNTDGDSSRQSRFHRWFIQPTGWLAMLFVSVMHSNLRGDGWKIILQFKLAMMMTERQP